MEDAPVLYCEVGNETQCKKSRQNSCTRTRLLLTIAVAIFTILSIVFMTMYFRNEAKEKPGHCQNCSLVKFSENCNMEKSNNTLSESLPVERNCSRLKSDLESINHAHSTKCDQCLEKSMLFNRKSISDYAISSGTHGNLSEITACLWVKIRETPEEQHFISYAVAKQHNEFYVAEERNLLRFVVKGAGTSLRRDVTTQDGEWHAICCVWSSNKGQYKIYKDGKVAINGSGFMRDKIILGRGTWVLGQDQDEVGGNFDVNQMIQGEMAEVNIWDKVLSSEEILEFSTSCQSKLRGNVKSWDDFMAGVRGGVKIVDRPTCCKPKL